MAKKYENQEDKKKDFNLLLKTMDKNLRKAKDIDDVQIGLVTQMENKAVEKFSTGSLVLDNVIGGGFPKGRIIEIYGPESSGKTSIALNAIANIQREGGNAVFIDAEQALDINYAKTLGVNLNELALAQESIAENALDLCYTLADSGTVDLIVLDSVALLVPQVELEADMEKQQVGLLARLMSKALRRLTPVCAKNNCTIIFLNQIREKVGVMFGNPETTPGGRALKFAASVRIEIRKKGTEKDGSDIIGTVVKFKGVKNKVAPPFKEGETILTFAHGINRPAEMVLEGHNMGILEKIGNTYYYPFEEGMKFKDETLVPNSDGLIKLGGSQKVAIKTLAENPDLYDSIAAKLSRAFELQGAGIDPEAQAAEELAKGSKKKK